MAKGKTSVYFCQECGYESAKWMGQCPACHAWNTFAEEPVEVSIMNRIILTTFTDPMMGLSYECEPVYEQLAARYQELIVFKYVMSGLVRDVSDFMLPEELSLPPEEGIRVYNRRLAGIYKSEESVGGLPMNIQGFHLFDTGHRSSYPLCVAYKAAQLTDPEKADA